MDGDGWELVRGWAVYRFGEKEESIWFVQEAVLVPERISRFKLDDLSIHHPIHHPSNLLYNQEKVSHYQPGGIHPVCLRDASKGSSQQNIPQNSVGEGNRQSGLRTIESMLPYSAIGAGTWKNDKLM